MFIKNLKKLTIAALAVACMIPAGVSSANVENVSRIAGKDRIATSIEISKAMFNESDNVVLASGFNFADALSAGQLAAALNAPLILSKDQLDSRTSDEIAKLKPKNIYIVGGETALSSNIEESVKSVVNDINIERLKGNDRYETSVKVMEKNQRVCRCRILIDSKRQKLP